MSFSATERESQFRSQLDEPFDLAIIGGGITGTGVARDAASRGLRVILFERGDLASGTSSASSRLIHGGLRYLEHYKFRLVHESVAERWALYKLAPHLVSPLPFLFPIYEGEKPGLGLISLGTFAYSMLAAFRTPGGRKTHNPASVARVEPTLNQDALSGAAEYYDCRTDDARLTLETAMDAAELGATLIPYAEVTQVLPSDSGNRLKVFHRFLQREVEVKARVVVVAAGPWTDRALGICTAATSAWLRPTKGVHLVFRRERLPVSKAVVMKAIPDDGRISFAIPWGDHTYVGTTDTDFPDPDLSPTVNRLDARYLLDTTNRYFPGASLTLDDIVSVWAGLRPLVAPEEGQTLDPSDVSREERIETIDQRMVVVAGGKLTTYRVMARHVVDMAARILRQRYHRKVTRSRICKRPLPGGQGLQSLEQESLRLRAAHRDLPEEWVTSLVNRYGRRAETICQMASRDSSLAAPLAGGTDVRLAELAYAVQHEYVSTVEDFLVRRTSIYYRAADQGLAASETVARTLESAGIIDALSASEMLDAYREKVAAWKVDIRS